VWSEGSPYEIDNNLIFSVPCRSKGDGSYEVVARVPWDDFLKLRIAASEKELQEERSAVEAMMKKGSGSHV
jgi:malate/lactate dehydrogenase